MVEGKHEGAESPQGKIGSKRYLSNRSRIFKTETMEVVLVYKFFGLTR